jgi:hypothetical protein
VPSSDAMTIPQVLKLVSGFNPMSILDVGCGNGKYGFLFREVLDLNWGRFKREEWQVKIDGVEIEENYHNPIHDHFYNNVYWGEWVSMMTPKEYNIVFMGDILEHFDDGVWEKALAKAMDIGRVVITVCPNWDGSINQGVLFGNEHEEHRVVLSPATLGGKCVWANTKAFITVHSYGDVCVEKDVLL